MADKKISQLTGVTTPLAGTEEIPVVQSGSTKKVTVDNLTAGKAVSALSLTATNLKTSPTTANLDISGVTIAAGGTNTDTNIVLSPKGAGFLSMGGTDPRIVLQNSATYSLQMRMFGTVAVVGSTNNTPLALQTNGITRLTVNSADADVKIETGNLVIGTAGKGIDFTQDPNPAGMTSELLDDYEEGTWTPTVVGTSTAGTASYGTQSATYTKIGRMVYFQFELIWNSGNGTGFLRVAGLPFTCGASNCSVSIGDIENVAITALYIAGGAYVGASSTEVILREFQVGGGGNEPIAYDAAGTLRVGGCYFV
jgi:hypothetical protein